MADSSLIITIGAKSQEFQDELDKIKKQTRALENQLASIAKISGAAFVALTAATAGAVIEFARFDNAMRGVKTLLDETSFGAKGLEAGFADMNAELLKVAGTAPVSIEGLTKALFDTVSAGVDASEAVKAVAVSAQLATAGLTDITVATDGITSALNAYEISADDADKVAAKFFTAQKFGKTTIEELAGGLGLVASTAKEMGVSFDELLGSVSALTTSGIKTNAAYTGMRAVLANIAKPTADARKEAKRLGIEFNAAALRSKGLEQFLNDLTEAQGFTKDSVIELFGSVEAQAVAFSLTGTSAKTFAKITKELSNEQKILATFQKAVEVQSNSLSSQMQILGNIFRGVAIQIGSQFAPALEKVTGALIKVISQVQKHPEIAKWAAVLLAGTTIVAGFVFAISLAGLALLKMRAGVLIIGTLLPKLSIAFSQAAIGARGFSITIRGVGIAAKAAIGATGIGLIIIALGDLALNFEVRSKQIAAIWTRTVDLIKKQSIGVASVIIGVATRNLTTLALGIKQLKDDFGKGVEALKGDFATIAKEAQDALAGQMSAGADEMKILFNEIKDDIAPIVSDAITSAILIPDAVFAGANERIRAFFEEQRLIITENAEQNDEEKEERLERLRLAEEALRAENLGNLASFNKAEQKEILKAVDTTRGLRTKAALDEVNRANKDRKQFAEDERKHGKIIAEINSITRSEVFQGAKSAASDLAALQQSSNSTLRAIGKAAALFQIAIKTQEAAMNIYAGFATIPIIGPALGIAGAAAAVAFGVERASKVLGAQRGGVVPGFAGQSPGGDTVPAFLTPGEFITPRENFEEVVNAITAQRIEDRRSEDGGEDERPPQMVSIELLGDEAERMLTVRQNEASELGISEAI